MTNPVDSVQLNEPAKGVVLGNVVAWLGARTTQTS